MTDKKNESAVVSVRMPDGVLEQVDKWREDNSDKVNISRSGGIVYLVTRGLIEQGYQLKP